MNTDIWFYFLIVDLNIFLIDMYVLHMIISLIDWLIDWAFTQYRKYFSYRTAVLHVNTFFFLKIEKTLKETECILKSGLACKTLYKRRSTADMN